MGGVYVSLLAGIILAWITSSHGISLIDTVKITECVPGKYFWRASQPVTFYACLNNWPQRAIKMKCSEGTYMCNTGEKAFKPCQCKGLKEDTPDTDAPLAEGNAAAVEPINIKFSADELAKMSPEDVPAEGFPARGCANNDFFELYENVHVPGGKEVREAKTLGQCQYQCRNMVSPDCLGVDWVRSAAAGETQCWFILPQSLAKKGYESIEAALKDNPNVDHYTVTNCLSTPVANAIVGGVTEPSRRRGPVSLSENKVKKVTGADFRARSPRVGLRVNLGSQSVGNLDAKMATDSPDTTEVPTTPGPAEPEMRQVTVAPNMMETTTTIPDSGCPYTFQEFPSMSHPYGRNITSGTENDEVEECKQWCLVRGYCEAVDFNSNTKTCYYLREINTMLVTGVSGVTHYRKVDCEPPLKCWAKTNQVFGSEDLSITNTTTPMTDCSGYCFTRHTMTSSGQVVERGCVSLTAAPRLGCRTEESLMTMICYCDTPRCNGFSVTTQASQLVYLPLDGDFLDHSGMNRDAYVAPGYQGPQFTCLDKSINCSALFMGDQCLQVPSLAQTQFGGPSTQAGASGTVPRASFAVFFKRISGSTGAQGIIGNSIDSNNATWIIESGSPAVGYISAGIRTDNEPAGNPQALKDFLYVAPDDSWHLAVMSYDGEDDIARNKIPTTTFYLNENPAPGNTLLNRGDIGIRNQPVSVGCVMNADFVGFLDEARIFNDALDINDVRAMLAMRDINFW